MLHTSLLFRAMPEHCELVSTVKKLSAEFVKLIGELSSKRFAFTCGSFMQRSVRVSYRPLLTSRENSVGRKGPDNFIFRR